MKKSIFFDEEAQEQIAALDKKMNLKSNYSAVVRLAIKRLYEEEMKKETEIKNYAGRPGSGRGYHPDI